MTALAAERLTEGRTIREVLADAVNRTMPSATIVGHGVSTVDLSPAVDRLYAAHAEELIAQRDLGLSAVVAFLEAMGESVGKSVVRELRLQVLEERMRRNSAAGHKARFVLIAR